MPDETTFNSGCKLLEPLTGFVGLSVDKINFVVCMLVSVPISLWFARNCSLKTVSRQSRLFIPPIIGLSMCLFMYGSAFKHVLALALGSYALMYITPLNHIHRVVFVFSTGYLSWIHWYRAAHLTHYAIDISGPMMLVVQRATTLAFNLHDGIWKVKRGEKLTEVQLREAVSHIPSPLEYFSYMLNYQQVFAGPLCFFTDYIAWIDERHIYAKPVVNTDKQNGVITENGHAKEKLPDPWPAVREKLLTAFGCLAIVLVFEPYLELSSLTNIGDEGMLRWLIKMHFALVVVRCQYYFAWVLADAVNNAAAFGFNGYDPVTGKPLWNLISNVSIYPVEFGISWKELVDNWNLSTLRWLRRISYDRAHVKLRTPVTYLLSAWWHGFFPAYYILFMQGALMTSAAKRARRSIRHYFTGDPRVKQAYDVFTFILTRLISAYVAFPFVYIWIDVPLHLYKQMYFMGHIAMLFTLVALPVILPPPKQPLATTSKSDNSESNGTLLDKINNNGYVNHDNEKVKKEL